MTRWTADQELGHARRAIAAEDEARALLLAAGLTRPARSRSRAHTTRATALERLEVDCRAAERRTDLTPDQVEAVRQASEALARASALRWDLALSCDRIAKGEAVRHHRGHLDVDDLAQHGRWGLYRAACRFEPDRGLRFSTYAAWWVKSAIRRAIDTEGRLVRLPSWSVSSRLRIDEVVDDRARMGRRATDAELADETGLSVERVRHLRAHRTLALPLDAPMQGSDGDIRLLDALVCDGESPEDGAAVSVDGGWVRSLLAELKPQARTVVELRFGLTGQEPMTGEAIAHRLGVSRQRVFQVEAQALELLRSFADREKAA